MINMSGVGQIISGPFTPDNKEGDCILQYSGKQTIQCVAKNYLAVLSLKALKQYDTVSIKGILSEYDEGSPILEISSIELIKRKRK